MAHLEQEASVRAGHSADEVARRARENAERHLRRAEMFERGAAGERATAAALGALGSGWVALHDHRWPGRRLANIDHVLVGPGGVFVIDSKNWSGDVRVVDGILRQNGRSREKAVAAAADAALAVSELVGPHAEVVRPVLCFTGDRELAGWARDVMVCSVDNLRTMLETRPQVLAPEVVRDLAVRVDASMQSASPILPARPQTGPRRPAPSEPPAKTTPNGRARRSKRRSPGRVLAVLVGCLVLVASVPTVLPALGDAVADFVVESTKRDVHTCAGRQPAEAPRQDGVGQDGKRERASALTDKCE
ncbi:nuclease-related domain-containing protein [Nocardioides caldifontis]|uniref:nuclease-related domain-containing protein n=1 Tax=Nocardioides caldifontis TaxID=2588938 RepID=UPI0011E05CF6|nr:nuclease-related domain-containing protein [Nocardioides caldifontis]